MVSRSFRRAFARGFIGMLAAAALVPSVAFAPASAEPVNQIGVFATVDNPATQAQQLVPISTMSLQNAALAAFNQPGQSTAICDAVYAAISKPDAIAKGVEYEASPYPCLYRQGVPTASWTMLSSNQIGLSLYAKGISLHGNLTTPTVFGSYADPCVQMTFDLQVTGTMTVNGTAFSLSDVVASVHHASKPDSCNAAADIEKLGADLVGLVSGQNFENEIQQMLNRKRISLNISKTFAPISAAANTQISKYATQPSLFWDGNNLAFVFRTRIPFTRGAKLTGTIARYNNTPACSTYAFSDSYEVQSAGVEDPFASPAQFTNTPLQSDALAASVTSLANGNCSYTITGLPEGVGLQIAMHSTVANQAAYTYTPSSKNLVSVSSSGSGPTFQVGFVPTPVGNYGPVCNNQNYQMCRHKKGLQPQ